MAKTAPSPESDGLLFFGIVGLFVFVAAVCVAVFGSDGGQTRVAAAVGAAALLVSLVGIGGHWMYRQQRISLGETVPPSQALSSVAWLLLFLAASMAGLWLCDVVMQELSLTRASSIDWRRGVFLLGMLVVAGVLLWQGPKGQLLVLLPQGLALTGAFVVMSLLSRDKPDLWTARGALVLGLGVLLFSAGIFAAHRLKKVYETPANTPLPLQPTSGGQNRS